MQNTKNNKEKTPYQQYKNNLQLAFGKNLSEAKRKKGLTNSTLCEKVQEYFLEKGFSDKQISENTVNAHLSGKTYPDIAYLFAYADILEVSLDYLFKGEEKEKGEDFKEITPYNLLKWLSMVIDNSDCFIDDSQEKVSYYDYDTGREDTTRYKGIYFQDSVIEKFLERKGNDTVIEAFDSLKVELGDLVDPEDLLIKSTLPNNAEFDKYKDIVEGLPF